jgi:hypothetical protein
VSELESDEVKFDKVENVADLFSVNLEDDGETLSATSSHIISVERYREKAEELNAPIHSARYYDGDDVQVVILLEHKGSLLPIAGTPYGRNKTKNVRKLSVSKALDLVRCAEDTPRVDPTDTVTVLNAMIDSERIAKKYCKQENIDSDNVRRRAFLYLVPQPETADAA